MKRLLAVVPAWPVLEPLAGSSLRAQSVATPKPTPTPTLVALGEVVLPLDELGAGGVARAVSQFDRWSAGFEPLAELDHPYLWSDELQVGPPDPRPGWTQQLGALESAAQKQFGRPFGDLEIAQRRLLVEADLPPQLPQRLPHASEAEHVALALTIWFVSTSAANDLCYGAAIGRYDCRGLPTLPDEPADLGKEPA